METLILAIHVIACLLLIVVVLLQSGHEGMGVIFGGGSSTMFGASGAGGVLVKITATLSAVFLASSLLYNVLSSQTSTSAITDELSRAAEEMAPAAADAPEGVEPEGAAPAAPAENGGEAQ